MKTKIIKLYQFSELSDKAKQKALEWGRDLNVDHEWYDHAYDDIKAIGEIFGVDIENIYFSSFNK